MEAGLPITELYYSVIGAHNLYNSKCVFQIFDEVEKRRQISMAMIYPFMQSLREAPFPAPGNTVKIKSFIPESGTEVWSIYNESPLVPANAAATLPGLQLN